MAGPSSAVTLALALLGYAALAGAALAERPAVEASMAQPATSPSKDGSVEGILVASDDGAGAASPADETTTGTIPGLIPIAPADGAVQRDCPDCPTLRRLEGGAFLMGAPAGEGSPAERPQTAVTLEPFMIAEHEITVGEFRAFLTASGHSLPRGCFVWTAEGRMRRDANASWEAPGYPATEDSPAACLSTADAEAYIAWLSEETGEAYRLPSEAEFEYAARAGSEGAWFFGASPGDACAAVNGAAAEARFRWRNLACDDGIATVAAAGSLPANAFGLHEMIGNLWEWTADCWSPSHQGASADGRARRQGQCESRVLRGGSWDDPVDNLRSAYRVGIPASRRQGNVGFRVAR